MIADWTSRYKLVLIISIFLMGLLHTMSLFIDAQGIDPALVAAAANSSQVNSSLAELSCDHVLVLRLGRPNRTAGNSARTVWRRPLLLRYNQFLFPRLPVEISLT